MIPSILLMAGLQAISPPADEHPEIIVQAVRRKCRVQLADRVLSDPEFARRAQEWAKGIPVQVYAPRQSDTKCLAKIVFRLQDHGVRLIHFSDRPTAP
jgi:hypothetical protein